VAFGLATSYMFRRAHVLHGETLKPVGLLLMLNYACYVIAEIIDISSIFALFVCALLCSHYAQHALSHEAQSFVCEVAEFISYMAEAFVFGYFGLTAVAYLSDPSSFSIKLILFYSACIILARATAVTLLVASLRLLRCGEVLALTRKEWCLVAFAGCMRGTIAYALILRAMPPHQNQTPIETVLISTVLGIVLINCLVFGGLFPVVLGLLGIRAQTQDREDESPGHSMTRNAGSHAVAPTRLRHGLHRLWHRFDERWMKPLFRPCDCENFQTPRADVSGLSMS